MVVGLRCGEGEDDNAQSDDPSISRPTELRPSPNQYLRLFRAVPHPLRIFHPSCRLSPLLSRPIYCPPLLTRQLTKTVAVILVRSGKDTPKPAITEPFIEKYAEA